MSNPFVAEIRIFPFNFAPRGWAFCNGQLLSISQNTALFSLLGTNYGGDGLSTFGLPNLQGALPLAADKLHHVLDGSAPERRASRGRRDAQVSHEGDDHSCGITTAPEGTGVDWTCQATSIVSANER